jgi:hypothetical protein
MAGTMKRDHRTGPARSAVIRCKDVDQKTPLLLFRVRNVIQERNGSTQLVAEEMLIWGYEGNTKAGRILSSDRVMELMEKSVPTANMSDAERAQWLNEELAEVKQLSRTFDKVAIERANLLIEAHERFRKVLDGTKYKVVEPVLPMDLMGIYILLPDNSAK